MSKNTALIVCGLCLLFASASIYHTATAGPDRHTNQTSLEDFEDAYTPQLGAFYWTLATFGGNDVIEWNCTWWYIAVRNECGYNGICKFHCDPVTGAITFLCKNGNKDCGPELEVEEQDDGGFS